MAKTQLANPEILTMLEAAPRQIAALTADLTAEQLRAAPAEGEWSLAEILAHLRSCADVWGDCIAAILASDFPILRAMDPRTWTLRTDYPALAFADSFQAYSRQRQTLVDQLSPLPPAAWERSATVTGAGKVLIRSVHFYAQWLARHERTHLKQIAATASRLKA